MRIVWDGPKRRTTLEKRQLDFAALDPAFFEGAVVSPARLGRFRAIGPLAGTIVTVIFAPLGREAIAVISMRRASRKERRAYAPEDPTADR